MHVRDGERNIGVIEKSLGELRGKLEYERNKKATFSVDLEEAEKRYVNLHSLKAWLENRK